MQGDESTAGSLESPEPAGRLTATALRLKELATLERVTEKIDNISMFSGLDGVLENLVKFRE